MTAIFISINYEETDPDTYAGVEFSCGANSDKTTINTGNPVVDYLIVVLLISAIHGEDCIVTWSSSVNHFEMDGGFLNDSGSSNRREYTHKEIISAKDYISKYHPREDTILRKRNQK